MSNYAELTDSTIHYIVQQYNLCYETLSEQHPEWPINMRSFRSCDAVRTCIRAFNLTGKRMHYSDAAAALVRALDAAIETNGPAVETSPGGSSLRAGALTPPQEKAQAPAERSGAGAIPRNHDPSCIHYNDTWAGICDCK